MATPSEDWHEEVSVGTDMPGKLEELQAISDVILIRHGEDGINALTPPFAHNATQDESIGLGYVILDRLGHAFVVNPDEAYNYNSGEYTPCEEGLSRQIYERFLDIGEGMLSLQRDEDLGSYIILRSQEGVMYIRARYLIAKPSRAGKIVWAARDMLFDVVSNWVEIYTKVAISLDGLQGRPERISSVARNAIVNRARLNQI